MSAIRVVELQMHACIPLVVQASEPFASPQATVQRRGQYWNLKNERMDNASQKIIAIVLTQGKESGQFLRGLTSNPTW